LAWKISDALQLAAKVQAVAFIPGVLLGMTLGAVVIFQMTRRSFPGSISTGVLRPLGWSTCSLRTIAAAAAIGVIAYLLVVQVSLRFPPRPGQLGGLLSRAAETPGLTRFGWALLAVGVAPPIEEFLFRGVLLHGFTRSWSSVSAAIAVTILFVASHLPEVRTYWPAVAGLSLMALALLAIRLTSRSLLPAVVMHVAYNCLVVIRVYTRAA
jgi:membrane protease YdiL (CAAX protease family)